MDVTQLKPEVPLSVAQKKLEKKQSIIEAARELFTTTGYESTTIADVARKAGVAVGTVYLYFKNKSELLYAVKGDWEYEFLAFLQDPALQQIPHYMRARPLMEACFELCNRQSDMIQMMGLQPQEIGGWEKTISDPIQIGIKTFFDEAIALGYMRPIDSQAASVLAFGMVSDALYQCFNVEGGKSVSRYIDALVDLLDHWLLMPPYLNKEI